MTQKELNEVLHLHKQWLKSNGNKGKRADLQNADMQYADMRRADMRRADLRGADMRRADLQYADLDYSVWPLWCGSFDVKCDVRLASQLAYHFCRLDCDDAEVIAAQNALIELANKFHRVEECDVLKPKPVSKKRKLKTKTQNETQNKQGSTEG